LIKGDYKMKRLRMFEARFEIDEEARFEINE
jgi:hypothetical protein